VVHKAYMLDVDICSIMFFTMITLVDYLLYIAVKCDNGEHFLITAVTLAFFFAE